MECPHCGCDAVINDKIGSHEQSICTECGLVVSDQTFEDDGANCFFNAPASGCVPTGAGGSMMAIKRASEKKKDFVSPIGLDEINAICRTLGLDSTYCREAEDLYQQACLEPLLAVKQKFTLYKEVLGACCVYVVLRRHQYPITAGEMVALRKYDIADFVVMLRRFKRFMNVEFPRWSIGELTAHTLHKANFDRDIIKRTQKIMVICDKCWLVSGRKPEFIIITAAYFSWLSYQKPDAENVTLKAFCKSHNFPVPGHDSILTRMRTNLIKLAECIPWITSIKPSSLRYHIEDIVKYKSSLMRKAFSTAPLTQSADETEAGDACADELNVRPRPSRKRRREDYDDNKRSQDDIDAEISAKYGKKLDAVDIDQDEFADEMDQYVKSDREIEDAKTICNLIQGV